MVQLVRVGNSQGIRIPKILIEQAKLKDCELNLSVVEQGLLISPNPSPRATWKAQIEALGAEPLDTEWLNADLTADTDWEW
jgi:antitoxin MazE